MTPFKFGNKTVTTESLQAELTAHLVPENTELDCLIESAEVLPFTEFQNGSSKEPHLKVVFMVVEKGKHQRKTAKKDFYLDGKTASKGYEGIALLDHICGGDLAKGGNDLNNETLIRRSFVGKKVAVTFGIFIPKEGTVAYQTVSSFATPKAHDVEIIKAAETAQPTATYQRGVVDDNTPDQFIDDEIPF